MLPGRCTNEMFCTLGASGRLVQVPDDAPFVCPLCGKVLVSPTVRRQDRLRTATFFSIGVAVAVSTAFFGGMLLGVRVFPVTADTIQLVGSQRLQPPLQQRQFVKLVGVPPLSVPANARRRWSPRPPNAAPGQASPP